MPAIPPPRLDDRTSEDLRRELVRRIPVHNEDWTDHNPSDPGITLIDLFSWLGENLLRRMERVPDKLSAEFLNLLGIPLRSAVPARVVVKLALPKGVLDITTLELTPTKPRTVVVAGKIPFQIADELQVLPVAGIAAVKRGLEGEAPDNLADAVKDVLEAHLGDDAPEDGSLDPYETYVLPAPKAGALPPAVELGTALDHALWVALLTPEGAGNPPPVAAVQDAIAGAVLSVAIRVDDELGKDEPPHKCPDPGSRPSDPEVIWRIATGRFTGTEPRIDQLRYDRVSVVSDGTAGLRRSGVVRIQLPQAAADFGRWDLQDPDGRPLSGLGALPPALDDPKLEERVVTWIQCFRDGDVHASVRHVEVNAVEAEQAVTAAPEALGTGRGAPGQLVRLSKVPVIADSVIVEVREPTGWVRWHPVPDLALSRADDPHYVLDAGSGEIRFGDGIRGRMPRLGEAIRALTWRYGGGAIGNVPAGAIGKVLVGPAVTVTNSLPASGGQDGETADAARARIPETLRHNDRAVAASDFQDLALATPGAGIGRVHVLPRHEPSQHLDEVPGIVTLVVLPAYDALHPDEPVPDREQLRKVCAWLEPRRLVTTELYVIRPVYVPVWISVAIELQEGFGLQTVRSWVELGIRQAFAPLPPYGPAGAGWPFGRDVRPADVEAAALQVQGVRVVRQVILEGTAIDAQGKETPIDSKDPCKPAQIPILDWQLPSIKGVQVVVGDVAAPIAREGDPNDPGGGFPVPVVQEVC